MPSNFRTYEAQSRLLAAVIASSPSLKLNFKDIAKYFGESTPMGIEFQFRSIRKEAKALREAVDKGESPLSTRRTAASRKVRASTVEGSSRKRKVSAAAAASISATATVSTTQAFPMKRARTVETIFSNEEESVTSDVNYDELDITPVSTPARGHGASSAAPMSAAAPSFIDLAAATPASSSSFVPDVTPALSVGATPTDESPDAVHTEFRTASYTEGQYQNQSTPRQSMFTTYNMSHFEDDEDDDIFIIDTPSKAPKVEAGVSNTNVSRAAAASAIAPVDVKPLALSPPEPHVSSFATSSSSHTNNTNTSNELNDYSLGSTSWDTLSQEQSQSHTAFSFDSTDTWTQPDLFNTSETVQSFTQETSFYDDDAAI